GAAAPVDAPPPTAPAYQATVAGPLLLRRAGHGPAAGAAGAVLDAGRRPRPQAPQAPAGDQRAALAAAPEGGLYPPPAEARQAGGEDLGGRVLPQLPPARHRPASAAEAALRGLAGAWRAAGDPPALPHALRHRGELPPGPPGAHLHLHARPACAAGLPGGGAAAAELVGLGARRGVGPRWRAGRGAAAGALALAAAAGLGGVGGGVANA